MSTTAVRLEAGARLRQWWRDELGVLRVGEGRGPRALRWVYARPGVVLLPVAALGPGFFGAAIPWGDAGLFREAGESMLGTHFFDVFSSDVLQIGPLYLLLVGVLATIVGVIGLPVLFTVAAVQSAGLAWYALHLAGRWSDELDADARAARWGVVTPIVFFGVLAESIGNGHPEELFLGLAMAHLVLLARHGAAGRCGLLLGAAIGVKLWAVLGAPLMLVRRGVRPVVVTGVVSVALTAAAYAPFYLLGDVNTFSFTWGSGPAPFGLHLTSAALGGWGFRIVQSALVVLVTGIVAWRWPGTGLTPILALVTTRLLLDPMLHMYYPIPFIVVALLWAWTSPRRPGLVGRLATWPAVLVAMVGSYLVAPHVRLVLTHVALVGLTVLMVWRDCSAGAVGASRRPSGQSQPGQSQPVSSYTRAVPPESTSRATRSETEVTESASPPPVQGAVSA